MTILRKLLWQIRRKQKEEELAEELRFHLDAERQELGEEAARRAFGNMGLVKEDTRSAWGWVWVEQLFQDIRYALRGMRRNPGFTLLACLSLALGIGANTAMYSFMDALFLRMLPVGEPDRLVVLNWHNKIEDHTVFHGGSGSVYDDAKYGHSARIFPYPAFEMFEKSADAFSVVFAYYPTRSVNLNIHGQAETAAGQFVSGNYFRGLSIAPVAGRLLTPEDDRPGAPPAAVLSYRFSEARFGSSEAVVGQQVLINNIPFTVVGVTPPDFFGTDPAIEGRLFIPIHANLLIDSRIRTRPGRYTSPNDYWVEVMGRLRPGLSLRQAEAQLAPLFHRWVETTATNDAERSALPGFHLTSGATGIDTVRRWYSDSFYILLSMVSLILAIACANLANLLLARAAARKREIAVRLSMGAGRWRIAHQMLTETVLLASIGGALGLTIAAGGIRSLTVLLSSGRQPLTLNANLNLDVLSAAAALSVITGLLFGLAPAIQAARADVVPGLKESRPGRRPRFHFFRLSLSHVLVVAQIAISVLLVAGAALFGKTLANLEVVNLGFNREHLLTFRLNARQAGHRDPEVITFYGDLQKQFAAIPVVSAAAMANSPLLGDGTWMTPVVPLGKPAPEHAPDGHGFTDGSQITNILAVGPGFFSTVQTPLIAGREFDEHDRQGSAPVAIINETWAKANFGNENPIGRTVVLQPASKSRHQLTVIGLAKDARYGGLKGRPQAIVYMAYLQNLYYPEEEMTFALRTTGDPLAIANAVREIVHHADDRIPVTNLKTQAAMIEQTMTAEILFARLCTAFAGLALVIACIGLYGTMAYMVARRAGEIGIRMALGARRGRVLWMVARQVFGMVGAGLAIGIPAAYASSRLVQTVLYDVKPNDPATMVISVATLLTAAIAAGYMPARRASRIDPMTALRHD